MPEEMEQTHLLWGVKQQSRVERLHDSVGLESSNSMRIVVQAAEFCKSKLKGVKQVL